MEIVLIKRAIKIFLLLVIIISLGTKVVNKILRSDKTYMLEPVEDGKTFWKKFGSKEKGKVSIREKIE